MCCYVATAAPSDELELVVCWLLTTKSPGWEILAEDEKDNEGSEANFLSVKSN